MPANHKVSVAWQIVFTFVPIANFWAFYRIKWLRRYLLYVIVPSIIVSIGLKFYLDSQTNFTSWANDAPALMPSFGNPESMLLSTIIGNSIAVGLQAFAVYLVITRSRWHNKQFDQPDTQTQQ